MKKRYRVIAAAVAASAVAVLSGCAGCVSCAGCGGTTRNLVPLNSNWYANTNYKKIQPTFTEGNGLFSAEQMTYKVTHDKTAALNTTYSVDYADGTYTTLFKAVAFDKNALTCAEYSEGYPENITAYYYKTELSIPTVTFKVGDTTKELTGDKVVTECYFLSVEDYLRPLYSHESIKSATPAEMQAGSIENAYREINLDITTYYSYDGNAAKTVTVDGEEKTEKITDAINGSASSCFDVAALDIVVRANKISANLNQAISLFTPASGVQNYALAGSAATLSEAEDGALKEILGKEGLYTEERDGEGKVKALDATSVTVNYGGTLGGVSQVYTFASIKNASNNTGRATLLKLSAPLSYSLGTLNYTLESIQSTLYKG